MKTGLVVGLSIGAAVLVGVGIYMATKKATPAKKPAPSKTPAPAPATAAGKKKVQGGTVIADVGAAAKVAENIANMFADGGTGKIPSQTPSHNSSMAWGS